MTQMIQLIQLLLCVVLNMKLKPSVKMIYYPFLVKYQVEWYCMYMCVPCIYLLQAVVRVYLCMCLHVRNACMLVMCMNTYYVTLEHLPIYTVHFRV